ncbi:ribonucleases P/MRP protein subunit POP1 [Mixophyes fleayi]|uniref:ribonucleases P/MRP protein subunit POP1 n=1 Tax=Mixophyes fleayi TaxID=3061075 RepID=UPI003F4E388B
MSTAKDKKYAKRMRNQPSNVSFEQTDGPPKHGGRGAFHPHRGSSPGSSGQQQRGTYQSPGPHFQSRGGGRGRGAPSEATQVPKYITATMFAQARAAEINAMVKAVSQKSSNSLVFQSLPRHMRRRAMGHDIKRLPRRLREMAKKEIDKSVHQKKEQPKSKCRKARRRHGNLQLEFNRRQRKNIWLESHIWHTKRYHMLKKWGFCLADRPTMKSYRACYRAMSNHCLLQDQSYLCCVELMGKEEELLKALSRLCSIDTGPTFAAAPCLSGKRQGSLTLYRADKYPVGALGSVTFIWKPRCVPESQCENRQLWIWLHPALKQDVLQELRLVCGCEDRPDNAVCTLEPAPLPAQEERPKGVKRKLQDDKGEEAVPVKVISDGTTAIPEPSQKTSIQSALVPTQEERPAGVKRAGKKRKLQDKEGEKDVPVKKIIGDGTRAIPEPYRWTSTQTTISIRDLTMEFVRYRLVGPLSHCVLTDALRAAPLHNEVENSGPHSWWADYCKNPDNVLLHKRQESLFQLLQGIESPAQMPSGTILGLTVGDPRLNLPNKRTKTLPNLDKYEDGGKARSLAVAGVPVECTESLIWSADIRSHVSDNKIPEQEINRLRSELLVPGSQLDLGNGESKIPVLLIQQPGKVTGRDRPGWGSGWDVCMPKGWGMALWIPLIYRGVRVGGLQQGLQHSQYMGAPFVPGDFPDTPAGVQSAQETEAHLLAKYTRRPPAKRTNFIKHGILAPFCCPWDPLTREWEIRARTGIKVDAVKQREEDELEAKEDPCGSQIEPQDELKMDTSSAVTIETQNVQEDDAKCARGFSVLRNKKVLRMLSTCYDTFGRGGQRANESSSQEMSNMVNDVLRDFPRSLVWVRLSMLTKGSPELHSLICIPSEQDLLHLQKEKSFPGPQEPKHSDPFKNKVLKLKKDRKKAKAKAKLNQDSKKTETSVVLSDVGLTLGLWPSPLPEVTTHCSRVLLGYVTQGNYSMVAGCGEALGFVSLTGLTHMLSQHREKIEFVLIRNPTSLLYRFAKITIDI